jgi:hypothetical protein
MESFEQKMRAERHGSLYRIDNPGFVYFGDAIKLAREADAALAEKNEDITIWLRERDIALYRVRKLGEINAAKQALIELYANYISGVTGYMTTHQMGPSVEVIAEGERLRARIRSLENES